MKTMRRDGSGRGVIGFALIALLGSGCPDGVGTTDGGEPPTDALPDVAMDDLADAAAESDDGGWDAVDDPRDAADRMDAPRDDGGMDAGVPGCIPGMSVACACEDGRMGAQVCRADGTFAACRCVTADAATDARPDVVLPPLGPRLITPQSVSRVTSRRPTMRWVLPEGVTRARVELCGDRACTRMLQMQEVTGTSWRPAAMLAPGVVFWRVRGLAGDGGVAWTSATWEYLVGRRDAPVDTSFGTLKDFNNDGYDDAAIVGNLGPFGARRVCVWNGRSERPPQQCDTLLEVPLVDVRPASGDFNGDGIADLAIQIGERQVGPSLTPSVLQLYYGRTGPLNRTPDAQIQIQPMLAEDGFYSWHLAIGDFNGDGFSDATVLESTYILLSPTTGETQPYDLMFFRGGPAGLETRPSSTVRAVEEFIRSDASPAAMVSTGDVNLDGYSDFLTAYPSQRTIDPDLRDVGRAWVVRGRPSFPTTSWSPIEPPTRAASFGATAAGIGDLNGDQIADFAIRSDHEVSVYLGSSDGVPTRPVRTLTSPAGLCYTAGAGFGAYLGAAGDFNGDGRADLSIGAPCLPYLGEFIQGQGMAFVYPGNVEGPAATPMTTLTGMYLSTSFGTYLGGFGDFNGDGFGDLSILETGEVRGGDGSRRPPLWVYFGSNEGVSSATRWDLTPTTREFTSRLAFHVLLPQPVLGGV